MVTLRTNKNVLRTAPKSWAAQYKNYSLPDKKEKDRITKRLKALKWPFTEKQVAKIIGNDSWTKIECQCCGAGTETLVQFHRHESWQGKDLSVCKQCLVDALAEFLEIDT
jgi:hypothetical protein